jgi:hypothetical protein
MAFFVCAGEWGYIYVWRLDYSWTVGAMNNNVTINYWENLLHDIVILWPLPKTHRAIMSLPDTITIL